MDDEPTLTDRLGKYLMPKLLVAAPWVITTLIAVGVVTTVWNGFTEGDRSKHEESLREAGYGLGIHDSAAGTIAYAQEQIAFERSKAGSWDTRITRAERAARIQAWKKLIQLAQNQEDKYYRYTDEYALGLEQRFDVQQP